MTPKRVPVTVADVEFNTVSASRGPPYQAGRRSSGESAQEFRVDSDPLLFSGESHPLCNLVGGFR